jgi:hypothetical protein
MDHSGREFDSPHLHGLVEWVPVIPALRVDQLVTRGRELLAKWTI